MLRSNMGRSSGPRAGRLLVVVVAVCVCVGVFGVALAAAQAPVWTIDSTAAPSSFAAGDASGRDELVVTATNMGSVPAEGASSTISLHDTLPAGLRATKLEGVANRNLHPLACDVASLTCTYGGSVAPLDQVSMVIHVTVAGGVSGSLVNGAVVSGGGGNTVSTIASDSEQVRVSSQPPAFGFSLFDVTATNEDGSPDTQAGSHPFAVTSTFALNQDLTPQGRPQPVALPKDIQTVLPAGLLGDPTAVAQCSAQQFGEGGGFGQPPCPEGSAIGVAVVTISGISAEEGTFYAAVYNLAPTLGEAARFGFMIVNVPVYLDVRVRSGGDYGLDVEGRGISQNLGVAGVSLTLWGVPADPAHDSMRGQCVTLYFGSTGGSCSAGVQPAALVTLPVSCSGALQFGVNGDSWDEPGTIATAGVFSHDAVGVPLGLDGCNRLGFAPSVGLAPDTSAGSTPSGATFTLHVPHAGDLLAGQLAASDLRGVRVALPAGLQLNPSAATGLLACSLGQVGFAGVAEGGQELFSAEPAGCPEASKVGVAEVHVPPLAHPLTGAVYLAAQDANPFSSLIAVYVVVEDPVSGVVAKFAGRVAPDPVTGQIVATFNDLPQAPVEDLKVTFFGGARAPLSTPGACGMYTMETSLSPWSGSPAAQPSSSFPIVSGPQGAPCQDPLPFNPSFSAGTVSNQAGGFSPFSVTFSRGDQDQQLAAVSVRTPPGLLGTLRGVERCGEPQASLGTCGAGSLIGHTTVAAGTGPTPVDIQGGQVFLTGPYKGAPLGLSVVVPAVAGPFDLGTVVVRAAISIDPHTAQITVSSDPFPTILDGIPLQVRTVNVLIDRAGFMFNPTSCEPLTVTGTLTGTQGASANVSSRFQAANCPSLGFKPKFTVSTQANTSKKQGASLTVKVGYPQGAQANIHSVAVSLPKQLPARLTTIQQACLAATFQANPASCPAGSNIGTATASTPVLSSPVSGPAYLVSHGGAAFPDVVVILQGEGVTLDLVGSINIKHGVTSSAFASIPDAPISSFELKLPEGPHSGLAAVIPAKAKGNMCAQKLTMPTTITGQNGAVVEQTTKITVTGCSAKKKTKAKHTKRKGKKKK